MKENSFFDQVNLIFPPYRLSLINFNDLVYYLVIINLLLNYVRTSTELN